MQTDHHRPLLPPAFILQCAVLLILFLAMLSAPANDRRIMSIGLIFAGAIYLIFRKQFAALSVEYSKLFPLPLTKHFTSVEYTQRYTTSGAILMIVLGVILLCIRS